MKKSVSVLLSLVMLFALISIPVNADSSFDDVNEEKEKIINGEIIPKEVAELLAMYFVEDNYYSGMSTAWSKETSIKEITTLYDENEIPSAYSVDLTTDGKDSGYVLVSAYPDLDNFILEYSDEAKPVYEELDLEPEDKIVYTGVMEYYKDEGNDELVNLQEETIDKGDVENKFEELRNPEIIEEAKEFVEAQIEEKSSLRLARASNGLDSRDTITDPIAYAKWLYGGQYTAHEWKSMESYCTHRAMSNLSSSYPGYNCGPTAITNAIEFIGKQKSKSSITRYGTGVIYSNVELIGKNKNWFTSSGTGREIYGSYLPAAFSEFSVDMTSKKISNLTYAKMKGEIDGSKPFLLSVVNDGTYSKNERLGHVMFAYAYTRFLNTTTSYYKSFLKVADGWSTSGRYIDMSSIVDGKSSAVLWTIVVS